MYLTQNSTTPKPTTHQDGCNKAGDGVRSWLHGKHNIQDTLIYKPSAWAFTLHLMHALSETNDLMLRSP